VYVYIVYTAGCAMKDQKEKKAQIGVRELRRNLSGYLRKVHQGASYLVMSHDEVVAELKPPPTMTAPTRKPGALRGRIKMKADFDMTPADLIAAMEGADS
jgi:antitoxin (DNA-binding transcriptional repressor) of toxin-antitoxin stability system